MGKYRKKPVVIEAIKWDGTNLVECIRFNRNRFFNCYLSCDIRCQHYNVHFEWHRLDEDGEILRYTAPLDGLFGVYA